MCVYMHMGPKEARGKCGIPWNQSYKQLWVAKFGTKFGSSTKAVKYPSLLRHLSSPKKIFHEILDLQVFLECIQSSWWIQEFLLLNAPECSSKKSSSCGSLYITSATAT